MISKKLRKQWIQDAKADMAVSYCCTLIVAKKYRDSQATTMIVEGIAMTEINIGSRVSRESPNSNDDSQTNSPVELQIEDDGGMSPDSTST